jgi:hypothetical protein
MLLHFDCAYSTCGEPSRRWNRGASILAEAVQRLLRFNNSNYRLGRLNAKYHTMKAAALTAVSRYPLVGTDETPPTGRLLAVTCHPQVGVGDYKRRDCHCHAQCRGGERGLRLGRARAAGACTR